MERSGGAELTVTIDDRPTATVVVPSGKVLLDTRAPLERVLDELLERPEPRIVLDLNEVTMCDSSALQMLVSSHRAANGAGGWFRLARPRGLVSQVLDVTNLSQVLGVYESVERAMSGAAPVSGAGPSGRPVTPGLDDLTDD